MAISAESRKVHEKRNFVYFLIVAWTLIRLRQIVRKWLTRIGLASARPGDARS